MPAIVWKGHLTFGLVSIPVKLFRAARRERVSLNYVHRPETAGRPSAGPLKIRTSKPSRPEWRSQLQASSSQADSGPTLVSNRRVTRLRQSLVSSMDNNQPISRAEVLHGYEFEPDRYVVFD